MKRAKEVPFDEGLGDAEECGIRFNRVKPTIPRKWQCKGVGLGNLGKKDFVIGVKPITTTSTTTTRSNCTEKLVLMCDQLMKKMEIGKIAFISVSAFSGILLVIVITLSICYSKKNKKAKVTINEPKKQTRNSTWYDLDITRASRQSSTEDIEQPPFEYKSVIVMQ